MFDIEYPLAEREPPAECCGASAIRATRFLTRDGDAAGVYYLRYLNQYSERGLDLLLSLGPWWPGTELAARSCFYLRVGTSDEGHYFGFADVETSPWGVIESMGVPHGREQALVSPLRGEIVALFDQIVDQDPQIRGFLARVGCGDATVPLEFRFPYPDRVFAVPESERPGRIEHFDDLMVLDGEHHFVRTLISFPQQDRRPWVLATWSEVAEADYRRLAEVWDQPEAYLEFSCPAVLANDTGGLHLPDFGDARAELHAREAGRCPYVKRLADEDLQQLIEVPAAPADFEKFAIANGFL
ncbi:MAG: DUF2199 domain-containing protein [Acidobacteriota bacterium]